MPEPEHDPEDAQYVSQINMGCVPAVDIFQLSLEKAEALSGAKLTDSRSVLQRLSGLSKTAWGKERRRQGKKFWIAGASLIILGIAIRARRKNKAAGR